MYQILYDDALPGLPSPGHSVPPAPGGAAAAEAVDEGGAAVVQTAAGQAEAGDH